MNGKTVAARVHDLNEALTGADRRAARGICSAIIRCSGWRPRRRVRRGRRASASATIVRFVAQLGFKSYPRFPARLARGTRRSAPARRCSVRALSTEPRGHRDLPRRLHGAIGAALARNPPTTHPGLGVRRRPAAPRPGQGQLLSGRRSLHRFPRRLSRGPSSPRSTRRAPPRWPPRHPRRPADRRAARRSRHPVRRAPLRSITARDRHHSGAAPRPYRAGDRRLAKP